MFLSIPIPITMPIVTCMPRFMSMPMQNKILSSKADDRPGEMREAIKISLELASQQITRKLCWQ